MFPTQSCLLIIILVCMSYVNTFQTYNDLHKYNQTSKTSIAQRGRNTTVDSLPSSSNVNNNRDQEHLKQHNVPQWFDYMDVSQGPKASSTEANESAEVLHTVLRNPQLATMLLTVMGKQQGDSMQGVLQTFVSGGSNGEETPLLSMLEKVQYLLSPEGLESEDRCTADVSAYLQGVEQGQMWALQMLDASGKPGRSILRGAIKFLGNYDECLDVSHTLTNESTGESHVIQGGYCHFLLTIPPSVTNVTNGYGPLPINPYHMFIQWDLCLPNSCNDSQVKEAASRLPLNATGSSLWSAYFSKVTDWKEDASAVTTVVVICFIVALSLVGTLYDIISAEIDRYRRQRYTGDINGDSGSEAGAYDREVIMNDDGQKRQNVNNAIERPGFQRLENQEEKHQNEGLGRQLLLSFSISRNTEKILNTRTGDGNLGCIHGIRVLSMAWVILGHAVSWDGLGSYENVSDYAEWTRRFTMQFIINASVAVDTFFLLSGCLVTFLFLRECEKSARGKPTARQMVIYYIHRWWRLTPVYMIIVMFYSGLLDHLIDGPLAESKNLIDKDHCRDNWWANLLYINNLYKIDEMCLPASWFLANDMQFYVVAPLALLPLAFGFAWLGYCVISGFIAIHVISYGYLEWQTAGSSLLLNGRDFMDKVYRLPWCRVGVFAIGMFLGVLLHKTKCKLKIRRYLLVLGWLVFLAVGLLCSYITYDQMREADRQWDANTRIVYETLSRPGWALFVSWIILVCCTRNGGVINSILSWSAWIPLGRLTYGAYLNHTVLLSYTEVSVRSLRYADVVFVSYHYIGTFAVSFALSFITCVLVESPCLSLEKVVLTRLSLKK
ncbi:nose resistant to fluoxetine protein 6-like [Haliotis cracherodii]|uniref:nose resistant to fluoxetine protein 6-like n=1 Tax=Haliotis cracherodii TaxID=6455 RepID=UPI0039ED6D65